LTQTLIPKYPVTTAGTDMTFKFTGRYGDSA